MHNKRTRHRRRQLSLALLMAAAVLMPAGGTAQDFKPGGLFGQGGGAESGGMLGDRSGGSPYDLSNQQFGSGNSGNYHLYNEQFGAGDNGNYELTNEQFGAPLGGGLLILAAAGAGYALGKRKHNKKH